MNFLWLGLQAFLVIFEIYPRFPQFGCHNSYFLSPHSPTISATWLPQLVFSLSTTPPLGTSPSRNFRQQEFRQPHYRNSNFFSLLPSHHLSFLSHIFCQNFGNGVAEIYSLSSFFQIIFNSTHITNKFKFLQYSTKRLHEKPLICFCMVVMSDHAITQCTLTHKISQITSLDE